jgi:hypothetical protein
VTGNKAINPQTAARFGQITFSSAASMFVSAVVIQLFVHVGTNVNLFVQWPQVRSPEGK